MCTHYLSQIILRRLHSRNQQSRERDMGRINQFLCSLAFLLFLVVHSNAVSISPSIFIQLFSIWLTCRALMDQWTHDRMLDNPVTWYIIFLCFFLTFFMWTWKFVVLLMHGRIGVWLGLQQVTINYKQLSTIVVGKWTAMLYYQGARVTFPTLCRIMPRGPSINIIRPRVCAWNWVM